MEEEEEKNGLNYFISFCCYCLSFAIDCLFMLNQIIIVITTIMGRKYVDVEQVVNDMKNEYNCDGDCDGSMSGGKLKNVIYAHLDLSEDENVNLLFVQRICIVPCLVKGSYIHIRSFPICLGIFTLVHCNNRGMTEKTLDSVVDVAHTSQTTFKHSSVWWVRRHKYLSHEIRITMYNIYWMLLAQFEFM